MVEDYDILIKNIHYVGCVITLLGLVHYLDVLKVSYGVEGRISIESAIGGAFAHDLECRQETVYRLRHRHLCHTLA